MTNKLKKATLYLILVFVACPSFANTIDVPKPLSPVRNEIVDSDNLVFKWRQVENAKLYYFYIYDRSKASIVYRNRFVRSSNCVQSVCSYSVDKSLSLGFSKDHVWRVRAVINSQNSEFSYATFTTLELVPDNEPDIETPVVESGELLAFPGALGFGRNAKGGRGGRVVIVNTVADIVNPNDEFTSLREAIEIESGARYIVFGVGGLFDLGTRHLNLVGEADSNVTIACQTAPSPVAIRTSGVNLDSVQNVVIRHCRVRATDPGNPGSTAGRGFLIAGKSSDIVLDHVSSSWSTDEGITVFVGPKATSDITNITISNSIVAEGDARSTHPLSVKKRGAYFHAMGPSCNSSNGKYRVEGCSIVNNFIAHNSSRNGMIWGSSGELVNNIVYNWHSVGLTVREQAGSSVDAIVHNNLLKPGPNANVALVVQCQARYNCGLYLGTQDESNRPADTRYSIGTNYWVPLGGEVKTAEAMATHPITKTIEDAPLIKQTTPSNVPVMVLASKGSSHMNCVGATKPSRDKIDTRIIQEFYSGTGSIGIFNNGSDNNRDYSDYRQVIYHDDNYDSDQDGMSDAWENANGLDSSDASDYQGDIDADGYLNIEEFLNEKAACN